MLTACDELANLVVAKMRSRQRPIMPDLYEKVLAMAAKILLLDSEF